MLHFSLSITVLTSWYAIMNLVLNLTLRTSYAQRKLQCTYSLAKTWYAIMNLVLNLTLRTSYAHKLWRSQNLSVW